MTCNHDGLQIDHCKYHHQAGLHPCAHCYLWYLWDDNDYDADDNSDDDNSDDVNGDDDDGDDDNGDDGDGDDDDGDDGVLALGATFDVG